jgi:hypothetical protein
MREAGFAGVFVAGLVVLAWVASGFTDGQPLALAVTGMITLVFLVGAGELWHWRRTTAALCARLATREPAGDPDAWLQTLPASLRVAARARIDGDRMALPALQMTPYLIGLLVMLGMLGTFLGMVVTLKGATLALGSTTDLDLIRAALAEPIRGLGLSFGTSVAGVSTSALLGLAAMLARRERALGVAELEAFVARHFHEFSPASQRQKTLALLASQHAILEAQRQLIESQQKNLPEVAGRLLALAGSLESSGLRLSSSLEQSGAGMTAGLESAVTRMAAQLETSLAGMSAAMTSAVAGMTATVESSFSGVSGAMESAVIRMSEGLDTRISGLATNLQEHNDSHLQAMSQGWARLETGMQSALQQSLAEAGRLAGESLRPVMADATRSLSDDVARLRTTVLESSEARLSALAGQLSAESGTMAKTWSDSARDSVLALEEGLRALMTSLAETHAAQIAAYTGRHERQLEDLAVRQQAQDTERAARELAFREELSARHAAREDEQTAARVALHAELVAAQSSFDTERAGLLQRLDDVATSLGTTLTQQTTAMGDALARSGTLLETGLGGMGERLEGLAALVESHVRDTRELLAGRIQEDASRLETAAAQAASGATEVSVVAGVFSEAVLRFGDAADRLLARLTCIEAALAQSATRSDEQLAYYVAQAREIIDLTLLSQKQLLERLPASRGTRSEASAGTDA